MLGAPEIAVIVLVALLLFGPKNLPKLGKALGETVKSVREGMEGIEDDEEAAPKAKLSEEDADKAEEPQVAATK